MWPWKLELSSFCLGICRGFSLPFFANSMRGTWDCNGKQGFFPSNKFFVEGLLPEKPLLCSLVLSIFLPSLLLKEEKEFPPKLFIIWVIWVRGWCSEYFGEANSWLLVQNHTLHCSVQILLQEGCKVLTPGEELTRRSSRGSLRFWALKDKKKSPKILHLNLEKLVTEEQMSTWSVAFSQSVMQSCFFGICYEK